MANKIYTKKCKVCESKFETAFPLRPFCSPDCGYKYAVILKNKKEAKEWKDKKAVMKEKLLSHKDYLKILQTVFNTFIRLRDSTKGCITCNKPFKDKYDAGHFLSVGSYPNLRFNEDNVFGQCVHCNQWQHGKQAEYFIELPKRIGLDRFNQLLSSRNEPLKLTIPEIKEQISVYKSKIKLLK